jgi:hypothetical protein
MWFAECSTISCLDSVYLLDDPGDLEGEVEDVYWGLVEFNENGVPIGPIAGLHESVLEMDPTGREMRPRVATND